MANKKSNHPEKNLAHKARSKGGKTSVRRQKRDDKGRLRGKTMGHRIVEAMAN